MRNWNDRDSFIRKTTRKVKDLDIADKCRDKFGKASDFASEVIENAEIKEKFGKVKNTVSSSIESIRTTKCPFKKATCFIEKIKIKVGRVIYSAVNEIKKKNPIAVAICVFSSAIILFGIIYSVFYTIFSIGKRR